MSVTVLLNNDNPVWNKKIYAKGTEFIANPDGLLEVRDGDDNVLALFSRGSWIGVESE